MLLQLNWLNRVCLGTLEVFFQEVKVWHDYFAILNEGVYTIKAL